MPPQPSAAQLAEFLKAHAHVIESLYAQAGAPSRSVAIQEFAAALWRSAAHRFAETRPEAHELERYLRSLNVEDIALACALRTGSEAAWEEFITRYRPLLYASARAIIGVADETRARELADSLYADLYGVSRSGERRNHSLIEYFHGRSKLSTWLRTVLAQRHVDALRAEKHTDSLDDENAPRDYASKMAGKGPALDGPDRNRLLPLLRQAVAAALARLAPADRLLLALYYIQEMTLAQIASLRGVHEATISRQLDRVRSDLRKGVESALATELPVNGGRAPQRRLSAAEIKLCMAYATDDWPFDLTRALADPGATASGEESP